MRLRLALACFALVACRGETFGAGTGDAGSIGDAAGDGGGSTRAAHYAAAVLADGPIGYWRLDETAAPGVAKDEVAGRGGAIAPAVTAGVEGALGPDDRAMAFDGSIDQNVKVADEKPFAFAGNAPYTVEAWFKCNVPTGVGRLISKNADTVGWSLALETNGTLEFDRAATVTVTAAVHSGTVDDGAWHYVVVTYDGARLVLYGDGGGEVAITPATEPAVSTSPIALAFGTGSSGGAGYAGSLDEIAVYGKALAPDRIAAHWRAATSD